MKRRFSVWVRVCIPGRPTPLWLGLKPAAELDTVALWLSHSLFSSMKMSTQWIFLYGSVHSMDIPLWKCPLNGHSSMEMSNVVQTSSVNTTLTRQQYGPLFLWVLFWLLKQEMPRLLGNHKHAKKPEFCYCGPLPIKTWLSHHYFSEFKALLMDSFWLNI